MVLFLISILLVYLCVCFVLWRGRLTYIPVITLVSRLFFESFTEISFLCSTIESTKMVQASCWCVFWFWRQTCVLSSQGIFDWFSCWCFRGKVLVLQWYLFGKLLKLLAEFILHLTF